MLLRQVFAVTGCVFLLVGPAAAEDDFLASVRLRGGYDTNPLFGNGSGAGGSAFLSTDVALAAGSKTGDTSWGVAAEAGATQYANPLVAEALNGKVILRGSMGDDALRVSTTTTIADVNKYNLRSTDVIQAVKVETTQDKVKFFVTAEGGFSSLNQTNAIYQDFLPTPLQYWRATAIPGVSVTAGKAELGVSVNLSARRYTEEFDLFGYRRDNERVQPFVFGRYDSDTITAFASVSQLYGRWHDVDFSNVDRTLFDTSLTWRPKPFTIELVAARRANETSFPISPITIDTLVTAKASWQVDPKWSLTAAAGYTQSEYLDSPFRADTVTLGVGVAHDIGHDMTLGFDLTHTSGTLINGERAQAVIIASSLTRRFSPDAAKTKTDSVAKPAT